MRTILENPDASVIGAAAMLLAASCACGLLTPPLFAMALMTAVAGGVAFLALRFPIPFCVVWLLITGMSLEMTFADTIGDQAYQPAIAVIKGAEIGLGLLCAFRFGLKLDLLCPAWAFVAMLAVGLVHGLYPGLTAMESVRSAIGSVTPFVFCFCRVPRSWAEAIIRAAKWTPVIAVVACIPFSLAGIRPLFVESGGARLGGFGHPAFLANVCLPAIYACLIQLYREGRGGDLMLLIVNGLVLALTGARAPLFYAVAVTGLSLLTIRSTVFPARARLALILGALSLLPVLVLLAADLADVRLFNVVVNDTTSMSGRGLLWPNFENAAAASPWWGWGVGAGNAVIPPDSMIVKQMHTWAAHNEYLRIGVEGGALGRGILIVLFAFWVMVHTSALPASDRRIMRLAFAAYAAHAITDNLLISTPACVMFAFVTAVFARTVPQPNRGRPRIALPASQPLA